MVEKILNKIAFTDKDNIKWWGYTFPGFQVSEPTQKTSVIGSSKLAARGDHSHRTGQLIETSDFLFMKNAERTKLGTYPTTYAQVQQYVTNQILGGTYKGTVNFYADLPTSGLKDGDIYGVLKDTAGGKPSGDYRYHNQTEHPTDPPIATGWYLVSSNRVPLASADYNGLLTSTDFSYIQNIKGTSFQGLILQGSTVVTGLGGITGTSNLAARADHLHDTRYLMLGGVDQTVTKNVTFSKTITIGAWGTSDIRDTSGNSLLGADATYTYLAKQAGTTLIRSGATDLIHRKNGTDYKLLDASNILALTIQLNGTAQPTYNGLTARTINITPGGIGTYTKTEIDKKVGDVSTNIGSNYLPLSAGTSKPLTGKLIAAKGINLNNCGNVGISFYSTSYVTWVEYMTSAGAGLASTGGAASTFGDVTSWARRSTIEATGGYGWIWDSCANTAGANPDPKMALSASTGNLKVKGIVTAPTFSGALSGNATTATTLKTARTLTVGLTGKSFNGSANVAWSLAEIGALALTGGTVTGLTKFNVGVQIGTVDDIGWYYNGSSVPSRPSLNAGVQIARNVNVGSLLVSNAWADGTLVPTNGIYSKGVVHSAAGYYVQGNRIANLNLTRNASMISRWDSFATSATNLPGADTNGGGSVNDGLVNTLFWDGDFGVQIAYDIDGIGIAYRGYTPSTGANKTGWKFLADTAWVKSQLSSGTVASANKLTTPRAINGTNFDGTAAITTALWGTARTLTIGNTGKSVNGSQNIAWSLAEIGAAAATHTHSYLPLSGGTLTGSLTLTSNDSGAFNNNGILFSNNNGRIGASTDGLLGIYAKDAIYLKPNSSTTPSSYGLIISQSALEYNGNKVWHAGNDGSNSGLDADLLDGKHASDFSLSNHTHSYLPLSGGTMTGEIKFPIGGTTSIGIYNTNNQVFLHFPTSNNVVFGNSAATVVLRSSTDNNLYHQVGIGSKYRIWDESNLPKNKLMIKSLDPNVIDSNAFQHDLGGSLKQSSTLTGAIVIDLPFGFNSQMNHYVVTVYNYNSNPNKSARFHIYGYNYQTNSTWNHCSCSKLGYNHLVRLGKHGDKVCIIIGDITSTWNYPQVWVNEINRGYDHYGTELGGVTVNYLTDISDITSLVTPAVFAPIAHTHAWGEITGKPSTFAPSAHNHAWGDISGKLINGSNTTAIDANSATENGIFYFKNNRPTEISTDGTLINQYYSSSWSTQLAMGYRSEGVFYRCKNNGTWSAWKKIATTDLIPTTIAWSNVTGKPSTFPSSAHDHSRLVGTSLSSVTPTMSTGGVFRYDYNVSQSTTGLFPNADNSNSILTVNRYSGNYCSQLGFSSNGKLYYRSFTNKALDTTTAWNQIAFKSDIPTIPSLSGGAAATSGQYVSGVTVSGHTITVTKAALPTIPTSLKCPHALTIQQNGTTLGTYDGSAAKTVNITATSVQLTKASVMAALNTAGTNTFTQYCDFTAGAGNSGSDMRFKKDIKYIGNILDDLMNIKIFSYIWNKRNEKKYDTIGVSAEQLKENKLFEKLVHERPDKDKTQFVDYDRIGVLALKGLQELNNQITEELKTVKKENKKLTERVDKLEKILRLVGDRIGVEIDL